MATSNHLHLLQVENCDSNSRLVVDEDDNGKLRLERVNCKVNFLKTGAIQIICVHDLHKVVYLFGKVYFSKSPNTLIKWLYFMEKNKFN